MNAHDGLHLPVELVSTILDLLDVNSLLQASHVSSSWRSLARSRPCFWRSVRLAALSHSAIAFFEARVTDPGPDSRSICLSLDLDRTEEPLPALVLALISRNLYRVESLSIWVTTDSAPALMDSLRRDAPRLKFFFLHYRHINDSLLAPPLPIDIFAGCSPQLERVTLRDVQLPGTAIPAFRQVIEPTVISHVPQPISMRLLDQFPRTPCLALIGSSCSGFIHTEPPLVTHKIDSLDLWLQLPHFEHFLAVVPNIAAVRRILCKEGCPRLVGMLVDHMAGQDNVRLQLNISRVDAGVVNLSYFTDHLLRNFHLLPAIADWPRAALFPPHVLARITALTVHPGVVRLVPVMPTLPHCNLLGIIWDARTIDLVVPRDACALRTGPLLPKLASVVVCGSQTETKVEAKLLSEQLRAFLHPTQGRIRMVIRQEVTITGDPTRLTDRFRVNPRS